MNSEQDLQKISELHEEAMAQDDAAFMAKRSGNMEQAERLLHLAYEKEAQAACMLVQRLELEPTRSILYRSAASLAIDCNEFAEAERLIAAGLAGYPPEEIAEELRDLYERVNSHRHLTLRGVSLAPDEIQMALSGDAISFGIIPARLFTSRINGLIILLRRTIERLLGQPFRKRGMNKITSAYPLFLSAQRPGSYAISVRVGIPADPMIPVLAELLEDTELIEPYVVFDEIMLCFDLFKQKAVDDLRQRFSEQYADQQYYVHFINLARNIAPDGTDVKQVGFTSYRDNRPRTLNLDERPGSISPFIEGLGQTATGEEISVKGRLLLADARSGRQPTVVIETQSKGNYRVIISDAIDETVRLCFDQMVKVEGYTTKNDQEIRYKSIELVPEDESYPED